MDLRLTLLDLSWSWFPLRTRVVEAAQVDTLAGKLGEREQRRRRKGVQEERKKGHWSGIYSYS